ncbi:MAG: T9SS type A sorting domain-containing protein, partial [Bacteroidota bacterium]
LTLFTLLSFPGNAQSISGNMNTTYEGKKVVMKYGNVDIYRGEKLVKSVITDEMGNFNVKLDTGTYRCILKYDGYAPVSKTITVRGDVVDDFKVKESSVGSAKMKKEIAKTEEYHADFTSDLKSKDMVSGMTERGEKYSDFKPKTKKTGPLTAGEVNDFSKWSLWNDYAKNEFAYTVKAWDLFPRGRYTVQLQSSDGIPISNAIVRLILNGKTIFETRSDNTGKAELWLTIKNENPELKGKLKIEIEKNGIKEQIDRVKMFEDGINHATLEIDCAQSQVVDIAFVFDATGSMGDELRFIQNEIKQIIFDSKKVDDDLIFRFANVFYRDSTDEYLTRKMPFTRVLTAANSYIDEQTAKGGGDRPEAVEAALETALNELEWSNDARTRLLFLMLDAPPHNTPEVRKKLEQLMRLAAKKGVRIIPIGASGMDKSSEYLMRILALGTNGTYTFLTNHSGIGGSHLAPTTDKFKVETLNQLMVRLIKSYTFMPDCQSQIEDPELPYPDSIVQYPTQDTLADSTNTDSTDTKPVVRDSVQINWSYYPNPTHGLLNIKVDRDIEALFVTDIMGKELMVVTELYKDRVKQIDLSMYPTGVYLIRYPIGNKWITGKVVLVKGY